MHLILELQLDLEFSELHQCIREELNTNFINLWAVKALSLPLDMMMLFAVSQTVFCVMITSCPVGCALLRTKAEDEPQKVTTTPPKASIAVLWSSNVTRTTCSVEVIVKPSPNGHKYIYPNMSTVPDYLSSLWKDNLVTVTLTTNMGHFVKWHTDGAFSRRGGLPPTTAKRCGVNSMQAVIQNRYRATSLIRLQKH